MNLKNVWFWLSVGLQLYVTDCLECYSCSNVSHVANCQTATKCSAGQICQTTVVSDMYSLGCKDSTLCPVVSTSSPGAGGQIVGRALTTGLSAGCSECCTRAMCNRQLCQNDDQTCHDSGQVDCAATGALFNICAEKEHAKQNCRRFCGLCSMVDGSWSDWLAWSACSSTCGNGTVSRTRSCDNPAPADGGSDCTGATKDVDTCSNDPCPVNGGWSTWSEWGSCSVSCGIGLQRRDRTCSSPYPSNSGIHCFGESSTYRICSSRACQDGGWTDWGGWTACSKTCDSGTRKRSRSCTNPPPSILGRSCIGDNSETDSCAGKPCHDGGWTDWTGWTACSKTCDAGTRKRSRSCTNPQPSVLGRFCVGDNSEMENCGVKPCHVQQIGFTVTNPHDTSMSGHITFTSIITNQGSGYNTTTGEFTCSVAGTYSFSLTVMKAKKRKSDDKEKKDSDKKESKVEDKKDSKDSSKEKTDKDEEKKKEEKKEKKKYQTVVPELLLACIYYDQNHCGYLIDRDVEEIIHSLGLSLSRAQVKKLVQKCLSRDSFNYRKITDKPITEEETPTKQMELDVDLDSIASGNLFMLRPKETGTPRKKTDKKLDSGEPLTGMINYKGAMVDIDSVLDRLSKGENSQQDLERKIKELAEERG